MPKSKDAFRTISEVADWLETPAHVLRFWESKFTQVKPVKRAGGRRYYRPTDMRLLGGIKKLLHDDGLTIKGAQKLLREHGVKHVAGLSQPLDEDLIDEDEFEEAAYEPNAVAEPPREAEAMVLSFPNRTPEPQAPIAAPAPPPAQSEPTPEIAASAPEQPTDSTAPQTAESAPDEEAPAFGGDALPAFMRRTAPPAPSEPTETQAATPAPAPGETDEPSKLTINPVAQFEPIEATDTPDAAQALEPTETAAPTPTAPEIEQEPEPAPITYDVPAAAKIAPELDSFTAPAGVLGALPGAQHLSPELAAEMSAQLDALRDLRRRMQNH